MSTRLVVTTEGIGRVDGETVTLLETEFSDLGEALAAGTSLAELAELAPVGHFALDQVQFLPPVARPGQIWAVGLNYAAHIAEVPTASPLSEPFIFPKASSAVVGDGAAITIPTFADDSVDFEGELALVIGRTAKDVRAADAWACVAGLTICNDVSLRSAQKGSPGVRANISMAKSLDSFCPLGPAVAVTGSVGNVDSLAIKTWVNDELRQSATLGQMIFKIPELIEYLTARVTLRPGDIIATGTPEGVGDIDGRYLHSGDVVRIEIEGVGSLSNPVVAAK